MSDRMDEADAFFHNVDNDSDNRNKKGQKEKQTDSASKLSHVPCRFYKVGACTAGQSCPFSHLAVDRGGPKEPCQWFVKGNCKFGHKCALAHILPGQPMSMDRKNKKAAQLGNQQAPTQGVSSNDGQRDSKNKRGRGPGGVNGQKEKDRVHDSRHERTPSKATSILTATAPGPPSPQVAPIEGPPDTNSDLPAIDKPTTGESVDADNTTLQNDPDSTIIPSPARPAINKRFSSGRNGSSDLGYGPIGSPPNSTTLRTSYANSSGLNQYAPSTSPPANQILPSTSPFAQGEGKQHFFGGYARAVTGERAAQSPIAIQRGTWRSQIPERSENAVESDEDEMGEDLLPSSLNELLTPEERQRRLSRSGARGTGFIGEGSVGNIGLGGMGSMGSMGMGNHRYSRSVPAARLLEAASAWKESDRDPTNLSTASFSFRSANLGSEGFSPTQMQLASSNASGAFLHGYARNAIPRTTNAQIGRNTVSQSLEETDVLGAVPTIASRAANRYDSQYSIQATNRALQPGTDALSPSSRALQAHAPGQ
ncbi:hypothetical protein FRC19_009071, partial [Serendipita sp. 401]